MQHVSRGLIVVGAVLALLPSLSACQSAVAPQSGVEPGAVPTLALQPVAPAAGQPLLGDGPGISVADAMKPDLTGPVLVNGYIVATGDSVMLCDRLAESSPPQCAGASMPVRGFDMAALVGASHAGDSTWSDSIVQILGVVQNGVLVVSPTSQG